MVAGTRPRPGASMWTIATRPSWFVVYYVFIVTLLYRSSVMTRRLPRTSLYTCSTRQRFRSSVSVYTWRSPGHAVVSGRGSHER